jgi:alkylhydroperoxidase/carboxymuconolactone decarboxylase family protein YurZ
MHSNISDSAFRMTACLDHHVALAIEAGATREEVIEAIEVAILIGGGPSTHYGALALEAYDELSKAPGAQPQTP